MKQVHSCIKVVTDIGGFGCQSEVIWKIFERVILIIQRIVRMSPDLRFCIVCIVAAGKPLSANAAVMPGNITQMKAKITHPWLLYADRVATSVC